jgi:hypothetical protein
LIPNVKCYGGHFCAGIAQQAARELDSPPLFKHSFGPMIAIYANLSDQPARVGDLDAAFLQFIARWNQGAPEDRVQIPYEYLLVVARKSPR